jgi:Na+/pantothenate symporter
VILVGVLSLFLFLGGLLHLYAPLVGVGAGGDKLFPALVLGHMPAAVQLVFFVALVSALFPSADGAITALTSSFCIDILGLPRRGWSEARQTSWRQRVHLGFAALFLLLLMGFKWIGSASMIAVVLKLAGYTYGPLLGLFAFGLLTRRGVAAGRVVPAALAGPLLCALLERYQEQLFGSYRLGLELLIINGLLVFGALFLASAPATEPAPVLSN